MAGHEINPNRDVKRRSHTACVSLCDLSISQSSNLRASSAMYPHWRATPRRSRSAPRLIRSAPSRPSDVTVAQNVLPPSCSTGPGPIAHPASRSMTSGSPSVTVMIRPAAHETTTRAGGRAGPSRHVIRRKWTGFVCEVKSLEWQRLQGLQDATA